MIFPFMLNPNLTLNPEVVATGGTPVSANSGLLQPQMYDGFSKSVLGGMSSVPDHFLELARERLKPPPRGGYPDVLASPTADQIDYLYAQLAEHYGMDKATAYNEAMANTAYQRAVADIQQAGLNPASLFSAGRASVAGSPYASGVASGGGFSSAKGASSGDKLPGWLFYGVTALAQAVGTAATKSFMGGYAISQVAQNAMRAFNGR